jgi:MFS family permease
VNSLLAFYTCIIVLSCGLSTANNPLLMAAVTGWFKKKNLGLATAITASGVLAGGLLVPIVTQLIDSLGWRKAMFLMGIGMWLILLPLALVLRRSPDTIVDLAEGKKVPTSDAGKSLPREPKNMDTKEALKSALFWTISLCFVCQMISLSAVVNHIMPFFSSIGVDRTRGSLIAGILPVITVAGRIGVGWMGDWVGNKMMAAMTMALTALGVLLLALIAGGTMWMVVPFMAVYSIGWGGAMPMLNGMLCDCFGSRNIASIAGFAGGALMAGVIVGAPLVGWIYDRSGNYRPAWFLLAAVTGTGAILLFKFADKPTRAAAR